MSNTPISVDVPHRLGKEEAHRRIAGGIHKLEEHIPGGAVVRSAWTGDRLALDIASMGQDVRAEIDVRDDLVRVGLILPPALAFFTRPIEAALRRGGAAMLEDKSGSRSR
jgi:Putative polyhydroxyalkanoic acid system protein (PHA_gran_rgn)